MRTSRGNETREDNIRFVREKLDEADAVLIGAGNGLSITEGLHLFADNQAFEDLFGELKQRYGIRCILQGMGARWPSEEEKWGFWSRLAHHYCGRYRETQVMADLKKIVGEKDYFVLTSNGEGHFERCGFAPEKICEAEGNWLTMQCASRCHDRIYPWTELAEKMAAKERNGKIPSELVPRCPVCRGPMQIRLELDENFIPETGSRTRLEAFLNRYHGKKLVILELGLGRRNQLIKAPLMRLAAREPQAFYVAINLGEVFLSDEILDKSCGLDGDLAEMLRELAGETNNYEKWCEQWRRRFLKMDQEELKKRLPKLQEEGNWLTLRHLFIRFLAMCPLWPAAKANGYGSIS